ncbi:MAG: T9SS type A sorting domain-containing protein [Flavobacteriales bacterium]|nr:T9SS type A sorting domain-containing protein [Flavobacteriales bacterium]
MIFIFPNQLTFMMVVDAVNMRYIVLILVCFLGLENVAQQRIDSTMAFQTDPVKQYSIYVPSGYNENTPNKLMLGLHPWNTNRWNSISWCDTLLSFAETNDLILICPDGGIDGQIDDDIDTAFTTTILDSMKNWYNIAENSTYAIGFSWGSKTIYTYGLNHSDKFCGYVVVGSAMDGTTEVNSVLTNATNKPYYIIHGSSDSPNSRYSPIRDSLIDNSAIVKDTLMAGVGHTIDFPNRNQILSRAYQWVDSVGCTTAPISIIELESSSDLFTVNNLVEKGNPIIINIDDKLLNRQYRFIDVNGRILHLGRFSMHEELINTNQLSTGVYFLEVEGIKGMVTKKIVVK